MRFTNTIHISRTPEDVFAYLAAFENVPEWNYAIVETRKVSPGPVAVGTTYVQIRSVPSRSQEEFRVTEFEPDARIAIHGGLGPFEGTLTYNLEPTEEGTHLTNEADLQGSGIMRLAGSLAEGRVREAVATNLQKLKSILESGTS